MANCKHCGADLPEKVEVCPNCGQRNTDYVDESYLDSLLNSVSSNETKREISSTPTDRTNKNSAKKKEPEKSLEVKEENSGDFINENDSELDDYNIFGDLNEDEIDQMISEELDSFKEESSKADDFYPEDKKTTQKNDTGIDIESSSYKNEKDSVSMPLNEVSDDTVTPESILSEQKSNQPDLMQQEPEDDIFAIQEPSIEEVNTEPEDDIFAIQEPSESEKEELNINETKLPEEEKNTTETLDTERTEQTPNMDVLSDDDIVALDDLFQDYTNHLSDDDTVNGLEQDLSKQIENFDEGNGTKKKNQNNEKKSLLTKLFANVPIDPSKVKPEPTPEEIEARKQAKAEEKQKTNEEKKAAAAEKKEAAKKAKEEKARQAKLAKEERRAKKLEEAKLILEEMEDTRINRLGASLIFIIFGLLAIVIIVGSNLFTYAISIRNAEKSFDMALYHDVKYYTDAYNQIYGLDIKAEDEELESKIMTVMFVNKQLNSYNNFVAMGDYTSALDALFKGLLRYNKYSNIAAEMGLDVQEDLDYVKSRIQTEMKNQYGITEDMADSVLAIIDKPSDEYQAALDYSKMLYEFSENYNVAE